MSLTTGIIGSYIASNAIGYVYNKFNSIVIDSALHSSVNLSLNGLTNILTHTRYLDHLSFNKLIDELDLVFKLEIISGYISDMKHKIKLVDTINDKLNTYPEKLDSDITTEITTEITNQIYISNSLTSGLKYLDQSLKKIHTLVTDTKSKIEYHQTKYFYNYRTLDISLELEQIRLESNILNNRFDLIIKIC
jgi:hypothetical protein